MSNLISSTETAKHLGISIWTLYRWTKNGRIPCVRFGKKILFEPKDIEKFILDCKQSKSQAHGVQTEKQAREEF